MYDDDVMRRLVMMWTLGVVVGCVESAAVRCPDGESTCPAGTVCVIPTGAVDLAPLPVRCVAPQDLADCEGAAPACGPESARRCYPSDQGPVCLAAGCANRLPDPGEQCDDGNNVAGDGCSADCLSDETCGNGATDPGAGEACDDGNHLGHDGCSSRCAVEAPRWAALDDGSRLSSNGAAVAFDTRRGRMIMFGGYSEGPQGSRPTFNSVWEWDGGWHTGVSTLAPTARTDAALAYDEQRGVTVMFGGLARQPLGDTWEWTGTTWRTTDASGPAARYAAGLVYDPAGARMVMFGGGSPVGPLADTWVLIDGAWQQISTSVSPPVAGPPAMAFDRVAGRVVLATAGEHWELVGDTWQRVGTIPAMDEGPRLVFDPVTRQRVLLGLRDPEPTVRMWSWTGQAWIDGPNAPVASRLGTVVADPVRGRLIMAQGGKFGSPVEVWDGSTWTEQPGRLPLTFDSLRQTAAAVDAARHELVVFGGEKGGVPTSTTLTFDGTRWRDVTPSKGPPARLGHALVYDPRLRQIVLFGGRDASGVLGDTWTWDGVAWTELTPAASPSARTDHAMAYDAVRERVTLFGGAGPGTTLGDTWEWDGVTWTERVLVPAPQPRAGARLIAEPLRGSMLLFGGGSTDETFAEWASVFSDTWRLDGTGWQPLTLAVAPAGRARATLAWNPARQTVTLYGGEVWEYAWNTYGPVVFDDLWEWDGAQWRQRTAAGSLEPLTGHVSVSSVDGAGVMVLGALQPMELRWDDTDAYETCQTRVDADGDGLAGCDDDDCWPVCSPLCAPGVSCPADAPRCGDPVPVCDAIESAQICPQDCGPAPVSCGDLVCDATDACPADCPPI